MAVFEYKAINAKGKSIKGMVDADSIRNARNKLKSQGIFPTDITETREKAVLPTAMKLRLSSGKISTAQLSIATRQLATLIAAGIPLVEALRALSDQLERQELRRVFSEVSDRVNEGTTLADSMRHYPKIFPRLYINMIAAGEASGSLDLVLDRLASLLESQADLRRKLLAASAYPTLMLLLCFAVVILLLAFVVPEITAIFEERKAVLPLPTRIVIALSGFAQSYWLFIIIAGIATAVAVHYYGQTTAGRKKLDQLKLRLPLYGPTLTKVSTSRFARTLATLLSSGVELLKALGIVKNIIGNVVFEEAIEQSSEGVKAGKNFAKELERSGVFPKMLIHMVAVGERTGQLEQMLDRAAHSYESEVDALVSGLTKILEPILILVMGGIVAMILASVMLPMLEMSSLAAK